MAGINLGIEKMVLKNQQMTAYLVQIKNLIITNPILLAKY
jgi:hypothetical protein